MQGLKYLHECKPLGSCGHGWLNSRNCLVDQNWNLKLSDFGLNHFIQSCVPFVNTSSGNTDSATLGRHMVPTKFTLHRDKYELLWVAPEHLRQSNPVRGSHQGDVYSLAMLVYELITEMQPYASYVDQYAFDEIISLIKRENRFNFVTTFAPFRPELIECSSNEEQASQSPPPCEYGSLVQLMKKCWNEEPGERPTLKAISALVEGLQNKKYAIELTIIVFAIPTDRPTNRMYCYYLNNINSFLIPFPNSFVIRFTSY